MMTACIRLSFVPALLLTLGGCATGIAEFQYFDEAYRLQAVTGNEVLDRLARSERILWQRTFEKRKIDRKNNSEIIPAFEPNEARYVLQVGDPPLTGAMRESLNSVTRFNSAMTGLATGEAASALSARMGTAANSLTSAAGGFGTAVGLPQAAALAGAAGGVIAILQPLFKQLAQIEDRARFQELLLQASPDVIALLKTLRNGTPTIFEVHKEAFKKRGALDASSFVEGVPKEDLPKLQKERERLAAWVELIDRAALAMNAAVVAVRDGGQAADVEALVDASVSLNVLAETMKAVRGE
jgi:hypothetical protein